MELLNFPNPVSQPIRNLINLTVCSVFPTAVPAPTDLAFGQVGPDTMEVTWVSPQVPNTADINNFLIRYMKKHKNVLIQ